MTQREDDFVAWARDASIGLQDHDTLGAFLRPRLAQCQLVFVGEADHWIDEKSAYRLALVPTLIACGLRTFGEELGWSDGQRLHTYLHGEGDLGNISLYGYRGDLRPDRDDGPTGVLKASFESFPVPGFAEQHRQWMQALCGLCTPDFEFFGFDVDASPGGAYADVEALDRVDGESLDQEIERIDALLAGDAWSQEDRWSLSTHRDSLEYIRLAHPAPTFEALNPAMALRERIMRRHVERKLTAGQRLVLFGHDLHLAKDDTKISAGGVGPGGDTEVSLGHYLCNGDAGRAFGIWMICGHGRDSQPFDGLDRDLRPPLGSLNEVLGRVGGSFALPTVDDPTGYLAAEQRFHHLYNTAVDLRITEQADLIVFLDEVHPLRG